MIDTTTIQENMEVIASDGHHLGRVDHVKGTEIELAKLDVGTGLKHHMIPTSWIDHVDEHVHLSVSLEDAKAQWSEKH